MTDLREEIADLQKKLVEVEAELDLMKTAGIIEVAIRNPSVSEYMQHWERRAEAAEARFIEQRDSLVSVTKKLAQTEARLADEQAFANEKVKVLVEALGECRDEIDNYIRQEYPHDHPVQERYRKRDFSANPARSALAGMEATDE